MMDSRCGFTLVELVVTSSMVALLGTASYAVFAAGTRAAGKTRRHTAMVGRAQRALAAMAGDIRAAVEHGDTRLTALDARYEGRSTDTIDFIAPRARWTWREPGEGGRSEVGYYIDSDPDTEAEWLVRREDVTLDDDPLEGGSTTVVGPYVSELSLEFFDGLEWVNGWLGSSEFPRAVRIAILVIDADEMEVPMHFETTVSIPAR